MRVFPGFDEQTPSVPVPESFFRELMLLIDDRAELLLTLYVLWLTHAAGGESGFFRRRDLEKDTRFMTALGDVERTPEEALDEALTRAVARGTLLHLRGRATAEGPEEDWYGLNTPENRERVRVLAEGHRQHLGRWAIGLTTDMPRLHPVRPNIFTLYEQTIGVLHPLIVDELRMAEQEYPAEWIEEAFRIAAERNVRHWRYVRAILERWAREGRDNEKDRRHREEDPDRYISGPYGRFIRY